MSISLFNSFYSFFICGYICFGVWWISFLQKFSVDINQASQSLCVFSLIIKSYKDRSVSHSEVTVDELDDVENIYLEMCQLQKNWRTIFTWQDGPLVQAMKRGDMFLVDEISLADDSVLERLNSVLEPERKLVSSFVIWPLIYVCYATNRLYPLKFSKINSNFTFFF